jgi:hypothetical protein
MTAIEADLARAYPDTEEPELGRALGTAGGSPRAPDAMVAMPATLPSPSFGGLRQRRGLLASRRVRA